MIVNNSYSHNLQTWIWRIILRIKLDWFPFGSYLITEIMTNLVTQGLGKSAEKKKQQLWDKSTCSNEIINNKEKQP